MKQDVLDRGFDEEALRRLPSGPPFLDALRARALREYLALPIPSQDTEEWRYTDLSGLDLDLLAHVEGPRAERLADLPAEVLAAAGSAEARSGLRVQRDSTTAFRELAPELAERGVILEDLDVAAERHPDLVEPALHALVATDRTKFTALHAAFRTGGTFLHVPDGVVVPLPIQVVTRLETDGAAIFPHTLVVAGRDSEVTLIDRYASPDLGRALADAVVEIHVGPAARVRYVSIQEWGEGVTHLGVQRARLARDAEFRGVAVGFGGSLARAEAESVLAEQGASSEMLGVFFADDDQHFDHRTEQDHVAPNCTSDLLYKGALRDASRGVYSGWVHVRPGAQKTDAMQTSRNVILSEHAFARAIPNLEIEANDVRCGHAASVGPVEEEQLFYLQSRGIPRKEAERLVVFGFFNEVLERIAIDEVRVHVAEAIERELAREDA
ncbi:MAG: Fe-S cluster assembly protein SufD [Actinomycetota bacterium]